MLGQVAISNAAVTIIDFTDPTYGLPVSPAPGTDITGSSLPINGITVSYAPNSTPQTGSVDTTGIFGGTLGTLNIDFTGGSATTLGFNFTLYGTSQTVTDGAVLLAYSGGTGGTLLNPGGTSFGASSAAGGATGTLSYSSGTPFDYVVLNFAPVESATLTSFLVNSPMSYTPVPEPASMAIAFGLGLWGFAGWRRLQRHGC